MSAATVASRLKAPAASTRRSTRKPVSVAEVSVHVSVVCTALPGVTVRAVGLEGTALEAARAVSVSAEPTLRL